MKERGKRPLGEGKRKIGGIKEKEREGKKEKYRRGRGEIHNKKRKLEKRKGDV
ncbi:hypothetical protein [Streptococcus pyogenes]|uniref:hypothetical protein n=1 Tax=Streptococcus pyogenes TaxID=1314 RepID=UPI001652D083|nr:hypothetical protein [Streptococcus pyogenes]